MLCESIFDYFWRPATPTQHMHAGYTTCPPGPVPWYTYRAVAARSAHCQWFPWRRAPRWSPRVLCAAKATAAAVARSGLPVVDTAHARDRRVCIVPDPATFPRAAHRTGPPSRAQTTRWPSCSPPRCRRVWSDGIDRVSPVWFSSRSAWPRPAARAPWSAAIPVSVSDLTEWSIARGWAETVPSRTPARGKTKYC